MGAAKKFKMPFSKENLAKMKPYQSYNCATAVKAAVNYYIQKHHLSGNLARTLIHLGNKSLLVPGVCYIKNAQIAKARIFPKPLHPRTIQRHLRRLEQLGIIQTVKTLRKKEGGNGANIHVIQPIMPTVPDNQSASGQNHQKTSNVTPLMSSRPEAKTPEVSRDKSNFSEGKDPFFKPIGKKNNIRTSQPEKIGVGHLDSSYTSEVVPKWFVNVAKHLEGDQITIMFSKAVQAIKDITGRDNLLYKQYLQPDLISDSYKQAIQAYKLRKVKKGDDFDSLVGYFFGTVRQKVAVTAYDDANKRLFDSGLEKEARCIIQRVTKLATKNKWVYRAIWGTSSFDFVHPNTYKPAGKLDVSEENDLEPLMGNDLIKQEQMAEPEKDKKCLIRKKLKEMNKRFAQAVNLPKNLSELEEALEKEKTKAKPNYTQIRSLESQIEQMKKNQKEA